MARSKRLFYDTVAELHRLGIRDRMIALLVNCSATEVRRVLNSVGLQARWNRPTEVLESLPGDLRANVEALRRR